MPLALLFKINMPKTETTVNFKSASFVTIMLLHKGLTHIQSQIKLWLLFGESFALNENSEVFNQNSASHLDKIGCAWLWTTMKQLCSVSMCLGLQGDEDWTVTPFVEPRQCEMMTTFD